MSTSPLKVRISILCKLETSKSLKIILVQRQNLFLH